MQASANLLQIRPVSASRLRPGHPRIGKVAEGVAIGAVQTCRGLDHLDRNQPFLGIDPEGRAPRRNRTVFKPCSRMLGAILLAG